MSCADFHSCSAPTVSDVVEEFIVGLPKLPADSGIRSEFSSPLFLPHVRGSGSYPAQTKTSAEQSLRPFRSLDLIQTEKRLRDPEILRAECSSSVHALGYDRLSPVPSA